MAKNSTITRLFASFRASGSVAERRRTGKLAMLTDDKLAKVTNVILRSHFKSLRRLRLSTQALISYGSAQEATKNFKFRAYHIRNV